MTYARPFWFGFIQWFWGQLLGRFVKVASWRSSLESQFTDWRDLGIGWPALLVDRAGGRCHSVPIWNFNWLRNRFF